MVTSWREFPVLLPTGLAGLALATPIAFGVTRILNRSPTRRFILVPGLALAGLLQIMVADLEWSSWAAPERRLYLLGGLAATAIAWTCVALLAGMVSEAIAIAQDAPDPPHPPPASSPIRMAWLRVLVILPFWGIRYLAQGSAPAVPQPLTILVDVLLFVGHLWSIAPLIEHRRDFPTRAHWTFQLWCAFLVACFILGRDIAYFWEGTSL